jgi:hypothetical protein
MRQTLKLFTNLNDYREIVEDLGYKTENRGSFLYVDLLHLGTILFPVFIEFDNRMRQTQKLISLDDITHEDGIVDPEIAVEIIRIHTKIAEIGAEKAWRKCDNMLFGIPTTHNYCNVPTMLSRLTKTE